MATSEAPNAPVGPIIRQASSAAESNWKGRGSPGGLVVGYPPLQKFHEKHQILFFKGACNNGPKTWRACIIFCHAPEKSGQCTPAAKGEPGPNKGCLILGWADWNMKPLLRLGW